MSDSLHLQYLAVSQTDLKWGGAVNSIGYQDIQPGMAYPPVGHPSRYLFSIDKGRVLDEYQLLYITRGKGRFSSASVKNATVTEGCMFLLFPGEWHSYSPDPKTGWKEYWIGFDASFMDSRIREGFFSKSDPVLNIGYQNEVIELYNRAIEAAEQQKSGFQQLLASTVEMLLGLAYYHDRNHGFAERGISDKIDTAKMMIAERSSTIDIQEIADKLYMSYSNFRKVFKKYTGFSPAHYIQDVRMNKVRELLTNSDVTLKELSISQGFDNYEYFLTAFRKKYGMSPSEYRSHTRGKISRPKQK